ncbi:F-box only protein 24 [Pterocles gutturalis]
MGHRASCRHRRHRHTTDGDEDVTQPKQPRSSLKVGEEGEDTAAIQRLPPEMLLHIVSFLTLPDLLRLGQTCCYLHEVCDSKAAWRYFCAPLPPATTATSVWPCKRAAILDHTKGLYRLSLGCGGQEEPMASIPSAPCHGYSKLVPAQKHLFLLDYSGTLFFLRDAGHRACPCQALSHGVKDVTLIFALTGQEQCDALEVYNPADAQRIFHLRFPPSIRFRQVAVGDAEAMLTLLLLTEGGQVYSLQLDVDGLAPHPIGLRQPVCAMVAGCGAVTRMGDVFLLARTSGRPTRPVPLSLPLPIKVVACSVGYNHLGLVDDQGRVHMQGRNRYGQLGTGDRLDRTKVTQVPCPPYPCSLWCSLNYSLVLTQDGTLLGCSCGAGGCLPGWSQGSVNFVHLRVTVPRWASGLSASRHPLFLRCGHDIEGPRLYQLPQRRREQRRWHRRWWMRQQSGK